MGELDKQAAANNIRVTKKHLWATGVGAISFALLAFAIGVLFGHGGHDLLGSGVSAVKKEANFEEIIRRSIKSTPDDKSAKSSIVSIDTIEPNQQIIVGDKAPKGVFSVRLAVYPTPELANLHRDSIETKYRPWVATELIVGQKRYIVYVGGFETENEALHILANLEQEGLIYQPEVVPISPTRK